MLTTLHYNGLADVGRKFLEFQRLISIPLTYRGTSYGLVTNFWGKFPSTAPPPQQVGGKLAKGLLDSHSRLAFLEEETCCLRTRRGRILGRGLFSNNEMKCVLSVKGSNFNEKKIKIFTFAYGQGRGG